MINYNTQDIFTDSKKCKAERAGIQRGVIVEIPAADGESRDLSPKQ